MSPPPDPPDPLPKSIAFYITVTLSDSDVRGEGVPLRDALRPGGEPPPEAGLHPRPITVTLSAPGAEPQSITTTLGHAIPVSIELP